MKDVILYIHGKGGSAVESEHYRPLFPGRDVIGLDYQTFTPWETGAEIRTAVEKLKSEYENITLIANSIGAYLSMSAGVDSMIRKAYFISPIVDMEKLIRDQKTAEPRESAREKLDALVNSTAAKLSPEKTPKAKSRAKKGPEL